MGQFNRRISDDLATVRDIANGAAARARVPGVTPSRGSGAGIRSRLGVPLLPAPANGSEAGAGEFGGGSGVTPEGIEFYPFLLDADSMDAGGPYLS